MITVSVKLFAMARDVTGVGEMTLSLEEGSDASRVIDHFLRIHPRLAQWKNHLRLAVNSEYVDFDCRLRDGDEVAIIPPVSGG